MLLVSNRLPVTLVHRRGETEFVPSAGGLAVALEAFYRERGARWVGWPGDVRPNERPRITRRLRSKYRCEPVFLSEHLARRYYAGFSNRTLWPLFHSFTTYARYDPEDWEGYCRANEIFADTVAAVAKRDETIWVHDYHLLILPKYLRERLPEAKIGFFLHIPFPPYDSLRPLPWHRDIVAAMLEADLIGFHTFDYAHAFLRTVRRLLGYDNTIGQIAVGHRVVQAEVFPMGIDFPRIAAARDSDPVKNRIERFREGMGASKLVFSISRLDYTKGIPQQLQAVEVFLEGNPDWRGRFQYLLVVVPSREFVDRYAEEKQEVDRLVGRINGRYGTFNWLPIRYVNRYLDFEELVALYASADVALVTPLRDGMNLVAKEYLAAKPDLRGALILSEMAGASRELLEAIVVNPNNPAEIAKGLRRALEETPEEQAPRNRAMRARLEAYDTRRWGDDFLNRLDEVVALSKEMAVRLLTRTERRQIEDRFAQSRKRLILLDYDGTLVPFAADPFRAVPPPRVVKVLKALSASPGNQIVLMSGRRREELEAWFEGFWVTLVAEHGAWVRRPDRGTWEATVNLDVRWKDRIRPILDRFAARVPGSFIEEKETCLVWHYRRVDVDTGTLAAHELVDALTDLTANLELAAAIGNKVVEVRSTRVSKGTFFRSHLPDGGWDFVLAAGNDWTDEALFTALPQEAVSVRVGIAPSASKFNVESTEDILSLLERLVARAAVPTQPAVAPVASTG